MEFEITRTSHHNYYSKSPKPCRKAYAKVVYDHFSVPLAEYNARRSSWSEEAIKQWEASCAEIKKLDDHVEWSFAETKWFININSLEELMALQKREGALILSKHHIEIYDDNRE